MTIEGGFALRSAEAIALRSSGLEETSTSGSNGLNGGVFMLRSRHAPGATFTLRSQHQTQQGPKRRRWLASRFASLTAGVRDAFGGERTNCIRRTFDEIGNGKEVISVADLERFAVRQGLPANYAGKFVSAVLKVPEDSRIVAVGKEQEEMVSFNAFQSFVKSRENALRKAFEHFDTDRDGRISAEDLEVSLRHVSVCCAASRCVYRCKSDGVRTMAREMFASARSSSNNGKTFSFGEFRSFFLLLPQNEFMVDYWLAAGRVCDLDNKVAPHEPHESNKSPWGHLVAGALAGAASRTATAPLETLRLAMMSGALEAGDMMQGAALLMARGGGWPALFRGNAVNVMRCAPSKALDFFAFDGFKRLLGGAEPGPKQMVQTFLAGGLAGATSWTILYPLEVVRSRITTGAAPPEAGNNVLRLMRSIASKEGPRALYRGLGWSVAAIIPEAALVYGLHDLLKSTYKRVNGVEPGVMTKLAFGVMSAFAGQLVAYPLETVSRRLQVQSGVRVSGVLSELLTTGGVPAFYRGVGASTVRLIPMAVVSFGVYEAVRSTIIEMEQVQVDVEFGRVGGKCARAPADVGGPKPHVQLKCDPGAAEAGLCPQKAPGAPSTPGSCGV